MYIHKTPRDAVFFQEEKGTMNDIIIIGAGPIGLACAIEAHKQGLSALVIERGCLTNAIYHYPQQMTFFSTSDRLEIGGVPFVSVNARPTRAEALEYYRRVKETFGLRVKQYTEVYAVHNAERGFNVETSRGSFLTRYVIIAAGFYGIPNLMHIPGEELPKVSHYYKEAHPFSDTKVVVIGGGNSAVDAALETYRKGAEVTLLVKHSALDAGVKYWVRPDIENRIAEGSIKTYFNAVPSRITEESVIAKTGQGEISIPNDFVLAMTGYQPDFAFLERCGIETDSVPIKQPRYNAETYETNVPGLYLAGVVCAGMETGRLFIENSRSHAVSIINAIQAKRESGVLE